MDIQKRLLEVVKEAYTEGMKQAVEANNPQMHVEILQNTLNIIKDAEKDLDKYSQELYEILSRDLFHLLNMAEDESDLTYRCLSILQEIE